MKQNNLTPLTMDLLSSCEDVSYESLQRTLEWRKARSGQWNGSENKYLMNCGRVGAKLPWGDINKLFDFGVTAEKHVFKVGMERNTGLMSMEINAKQLEWGNENESKLVDQLIKDGEISDFRELGSEKFKNYDKGSASVDGMCIYKGEYLPMELKCTVSWDGYYNRMYEPVSEKHNDFWQHQSEMLATDSKKLLYVVALPMQTEKYKIQIVEASEVHQQSLIHRGKIADLSFSYWESYGYKKESKEAWFGYKQSLIDACKNYKM